MHHYVNKEVSEDIVNGGGEVLVGVGATLTEADIDRILEDGTVSEISVRNNEIDGIEIEAITENGTEIESLRDRIIGRTLAEDIEDAEAMCCSTSMNILRKTWQTKSRRSVTKLRSARF